MTYERHWFSVSESRIFKRPDNQYVQPTDSQYLAWKEERRQVYTTETHEETVIQYDEFGNPYEVTIEVTVQVPVIEEYTTYDEFGNPTGTATRYQTELVNPTIREVSLDRFILIQNGIPVANPNKAQVLADEAYAKAHPAPTDAERIKMLEKLILELTAQ